MEVPNDDGNGVGTLAQPGALVKDPPAGVGVISTGRPALIGAGVGNDTVAGIGAIVSGNGD